MSKFNSMVFPSPSLRYRVYRLENDIKTECIYETNDFRDAVDYCSMRLHPDEFSIVDSKSPESR